jgi:IS30 family transposase
MSFCCEPFQCFAHGHDVVKNQQVSYEWLYLMNLCCSSSMPSAASAPPPKASRHVRKLPASLRRSLTWDRGLEMAKQKSFTVATKVQVYFCDPQCPWQRGTN